tara:strand:+ start:440 stop:1861 length:1422 start_codon:yes stop_codon:yes gene_type:complete
MNTDQKERLLELAHGHIEKKLSADEIAELESLLDSAPEARRLFTDFMHDHAVLHWQHIGEQSGEPLSGITEITDFRPSRIPSLPQILVAAAVVALLALVLVRPAAAPPSYATMTTTEAARWESGSLPTADGSRLGAGELRLTEGLATLAFDSGAILVLEGPARLEIQNAMNCVLTEGTAVAEVAESAHGFRIETPRANVIDHGTRFAVNVDPVSGATQTQVFEGLVEVELASTRESIELKTGQQNYVAGDELGNIGNSPDEVAWSSTGRSSPTRENWVTVTTTEGKGTDGYIWDGEPNGHTSDDLLLLKRSLSDKGPDRKAYLRFDLSSLPGDQVDAAELTLQFTPTGWGLAALVDDSVFEVFGLTDNSLDDWAYSSMNWENAPANDLDSGNQLVSEKVVSLGSFTVPRGVQSGSFLFDGALLTQFINQDANRLATLIIVRQSVESENGGLVHGIASRRHPSLPAPTLSIKLK